MISRAEFANSRSGRNEAKRRRNAKTCKWIITVSYFFIGICAYYACIRLILNSCDDVLSWMGTAAAGNLILCVAIENIIRPYTDRNELSPPPHLDFS